MGLGSRIFAGVLLAFTGFFFLSCLAASIFIAYEIAIGSDVGGLPTRAIVLVAIVSILLCLLLGRISVGLALAMIGRQPKYLLPPVIQVVFAFLFGMTGVGMFIAGLFGAPGGTLRHLPVSLVFLGFAVQQTRTWLRGRSTRA